MIDEYDQVLRRALHNERTSKILLESSDEKKIREANNWATVRMIHPLPVSKPNRPKCKVTGEDLVVKDWVFGEDGLWKYQTVKVNSQNERHKRISKMEKIRSLEDRKIGMLFSSSSTVVPNIIDRKSEVETKSEIVPKKEPLDTSMETRINQIRERAQKNIFQSLEVKSKSSSRRNLSKPKQELAIITKSEVFPVPASSRETFREKQEKRIYNKRSREFPRQISKDYEDKENPPRENSPKKDSKNKKEAKKKNKKPKTKT